jgi:anti-sigma factor RsiW
MKTNAEKPDDRELSAYVDGQLSPEDAAEIEARFTASPEEAARVESYLQQNRLIRDAADALEPAAADLRTAALERQLAQRLERRVGQRWRMPAWVRQAAAAVVLISAGWLAHGQYAALDQAPPGYVAEAVGAHRVFADDAVRPVEFVPEASDAALRWASAKLGQPVDIPKLDSLGLGLVGSRLHGTAEGPIAQFIYEDEGGNRLSVIVAPHPPEVPAYDFTQASFQETRVGYWSALGLDYAVVAETSAPQIEAIASEIAAPGSAL